MNQNLKSSRTVSPLYSLDYWMRKALVAARKAEALDEVPVGAVIVLNSQLISIGYNRKEQIPSALGHAELIALHKASKKLGAWRLADCELYVTLEPCSMCAGALVQARIGKLFFGAFDPKAGACGSVLSLHEHPKLNHQFSAQGGVLEKECSHILKNFFRNKRIAKRSAQSES